MVGGCLKEAKSMCNKSSIQRRAAIAALTILILTIMTTAQSRRGVTTAGNEVTIVVTAHPHNDRTREVARKLQADDFSVREDKQPQQIVSVKRTSEAPPIIEVLIQDD